jgi:WD40 repeat protein
LKIWDAETGEALKHLDGHADYVTTCDFSPDGLHIISASRDGTWKLWDAATGQELRCVKAHDGKVSYCSFSKSETLIVSVAADHTAKVWDVMTGALLAEYDAGCDIEAFDWHPSGREFAVGDVNGWLKLLRIENLPPMSPVVPVVLAWRGPLRGAQSDDAGELAIGCQLCRSWSVISSASLDAELNCPHCSRRLRLGPFTISADWRPIERAWQGVTDTNAQPGITPAGESAGAGVDTERIKLTKRWWQFWRI